MTASLLPDGHWISAQQAAALVQRISPLVRFGTSSWTYPGWRGLVYPIDLPAKASPAQQLAEYARWPLFTTVGIDSFFYSEPPVDTLEAYRRVLPPGFPCVSKVWNRITARSFSSPRETHHRGELNPDWLNADLFIAEVLEPLRQHFVENCGPLMFEIQSIRSRDDCTLDQFLTRLDAFLAALPQDFRYAVEVRNAEFLVPAYFAVLRDHGVAHVFNSWTRMPPIGEQLLLHDSITTDFVIARALLRPGRRYATAVESFAPYNRIQDPNPELRADLVALARTAINLRIPAYLLVNNRAEGCSPMTILSVAEMLAAVPG